MLGSAQEPLGNAQELLGSAQEPLVSDQERMRRSFRLRMRCCCGWLVPMRGQGGTEAVPRRCRGCEP